MKHIFVEKLLKLETGSKQGHSTECSGGQFWKRLRFTEDCNARRRRMLEAEEK